jgi:hypothetical protein
MSDINDPKETISDDSDGKIAPELVTKYDFDTELEDEEVSELDDRENWIVDNYTTYIDMAQLDKDLAYQDQSTYRPAQVIRVLRRIARTLPSGQVVLDYELEVQEVVGARSYELRVSQV